jgi:hypothetical protein
MESKIDTAMSVNVRLLLALLFFTSAICLAGDGEDRQGEGKSFLGGIGRSLVTGIHERTTRLVDGVRGGGISVGNMFTGGSFIRRYVTAEISKVHLEQYERVEYFLQGVDSLFEDSYVLSVDWLEETLQENSIEAAAVVDATGGVTFVGEKYPLDGDLVESPDGMSLPSGFLVDAEGGLHFRIASTRDGKVYDVLVAQENLSRELDTGLRSRTVLLYDGASGHEAILIGDGEVDAQEFLSGGAEIPRRTGRGRYLAASRMKNLPGDLYLVSLLPPQLGFHGYYLIGLILLVGFAMFLIVATARYSVPIMRRFSRGIAMAERAGEEPKPVGDAPTGRGEDSTVISEIDREISDIIEEDKGEKEPAVGDERIKKLKEDGIVIRK